MDLGKKLRVVEVPEPIRVPTFTPVSVPVETPELVPVKRESNG